MRPKLRNIQPQWIEHDGRPVLLLRDPLGISDKVLAVPEQVAPLLAFCDGTRDESALLAAMQIRAGVRMLPSHLTQILQQLDDALMLDNERFHAAYAAAVREFQAAPYRAPALAGSGYPSDPDALTSLLATYTGDAPPAASTAEIRGVISPHIDYQRGGPVYGKVWKAAAGAAREADVVVVFGTDHMGDRAPFTLTRQNYATPYGVLPSDAGALDALAAAVGAESAFAEEFHHKNEHSIELSLAWLHYARQGKPCPVVPILSGSFDRFVSGGTGPTTDDVIGRGVGALREALLGRKVLVVASADLAHMGPAFGPSLPANALQRALAKKADHELIRAICSGDAEGFFQQIRAEGDRRHICGLPPIYLAMRLLQPVSGDLIAYDQAPADAQNASFVSFCGVVLR